MNVSRDVDGKTFLANLRLSKLLPEAELAQALAHLPATCHGRAFAQVLVQKELLTSFQAEHLLAGHNTGYFLGQYRILDQLGRGGMGRVFKAEHLTMKRVVALKVLAPNLLQSERARTLFLREVQAIAQLIHPNIVAAYDASQDDGRYYLVLEFVDGPNLDQLVRGQGPLPIGLACDYIKQAASGLQAAHIRGMVHRDIKPANLLVQRRGLNDPSPGLLKLSDFGLARLQAPDGRAGSHSHPGTILARQQTVMGTPDYLSPEQAQDLHGVDIRSDLYSLGCTFYFLLTGQVPFPGGTPVDKVLRHVRDLPVSALDLRPDVPAEVMAILSRLMCKDPAERYQTPLELVAALEPFAVSGPTPWACPPSARFSADTAPTGLMDTSPSTVHLHEAKSEDDWSVLSRLEEPDAPRVRLRPRRLRRLRLVLRRRRTLWVVLACTLLTLLAVGALWMAVQP